ncbi:MAG: hypothetical protein K1W33_07115 [Clostridia bacterium]
MTYGENKRIMLALVDEYSPTNQYFTTDEDIKEKCALIYAPAYQELADMKTTLKTKEFEIIEENEGYEEYTLPSCKQIKRIMVLDENNNPISGNYYTLGRKIFISQEKKARYILEYMPFLNLINSETKDDFELEIDQDLQVLLPYLVANDLLKTDPSANYRAFLQEYERKLKSLNTNKWGISVNITEGEL